MKHQPIKTRHAVGIGLLLVLFVLYASWSRVIRHPKVVRETVATERLQPSASTPTDKATKAKPDPIFGPAAKSSKLTPKQRISKLVVRMMEDKWLSVRQWTVAEKLHFYVVE